MVRTVEYDLVVDTSCFTALQLQPGLVLAQSWNSLAAWCRAHLVPYPQLVCEHGVGAVVLAVEVRYPQRLGFFDSDTLTVRTRLGLRRRGTRLEQHTTITAAARTAAAVRTVLCPVAIREPMSLTAEPAPLPDALAQRFRDDEVDPSAPERTLPALLDAVRGFAGPIAEGLHPFRIARHHCELADQWAFPAVPALVGSAREELAVEHALTRGLAEPVTAIDIELSRPFYVFDHGVVATAAYEGAFVHRLCADGQEEPHGVVVERFG